MTTVIRASERDALALLLYAERFSIRFHMAGLPAPLTSKLAELELAGYVEIYDDPADGDDADPRVRLTAPGAVVVHGALRRSR